MIRIRLAILLAGSALLAACTQPQSAPPPQQAAAQPAGPVYTFRLVPGRNLVGCQRLDAAMSRQHTVTVVGDKAIIRSNGGIDDDAKQTSPGVYVTNFSLGGVRLDVVADLSKDPKTLVVTEKNAGCSWRG